MIADRFLLPSLVRISTRYGLSRDVTGFVVALGNLVPETTTTILSFTKHGVKMTEFAMAANLGSAIFTITVVPAVAAAFLQGHAVSSDISKKTFYRDMGFFLVTVLIFDFILQPDGVVSLAESILLLAWLFVYMGVATYQNKTA